MHSPQTSHGTFAEKLFFQGEIMKVVQSLLVAAAVAFPALSFAQTNQPLTRAEVRAQLVQLENVGYNPASDQAQYPKNIEAANARLSAQEDLASSSYGPSIAGISESGAATHAASHAAAASVTGLGSLYSKH
jgi:hypothetical protein